MLKLCVSVFDGVSMAFRCYGFNRDFLPPDVRNAAPLRIDEYDHASYPRQTM
jgi:hypothetical protein